MKKFNVLTPIFVATFYFVPGGFAQAASKKQCVGKAIKLVSDVTQKELKILAKKIQIIEVQLAIVDKGTSRAQVLLAQRKLSDLISELAEVNSNPQEHSRFMDSLLYIAYRRTQKDLMDWRDNLVRRFNQINNAV